MGCKLVGRDADAECPSPRSPECLAVPQIGQSTNCTEPCSVNERVVDQVADQPANIRTGICQ